MPRQTEINRGYNEPWHYIHPHVRDAKGNQVYADTRNKEHMAAAVTAVAGKNLAALRALEGAIKEAIAVPGVRSSARLKKIYEAYTQSETIPVGTEDIDADVRQMLTVIRDLVHSVVETTAIIRRVYTDGTGEDIARAVTLKPKSLNGWKNRAHEALKAASYYVPIPPEPKVTWADYAPENDGATEL